MTTNGIPRPMKFNSMQDFVFGNSGQFGKSFRSKSPQSGVFLIKPTESYYDRYNISNLQLRHVNKNHLQILNKNIVLAEQDIHPNAIFATTSLNRTNLIQTMKQPTFLNTTQNNNFFQTNATGLPQNDTVNQPYTDKKIIPFTSQGFFTPNQKPSKQYSENQLMFNFMKIAEQKKSKKKQFLQTIEAKLNLVQEQAKQLEQCQFLEQINLKQIQKINRQIGHELASNSFASKIKEKVALNLQNYEDDDQDINKPQSLHLGMSPVQINHVLQSHYDQNQKILNEIMRVKSKSKQKSSHGQTQTNFGRTQHSQAKQFQKTGKSSNGFASNNKKIVAYATMKYPPKHKK